LASNINDLYRFQMSSLLSRIVIFLFNVFFVIA
jgi:hypothetical protein